MASEFNADDILEVSISGSISGLTSGSLTLRPLFLNPVQTRWPYACKTDQSECR